MNSFEIRIFGKGGHGTKPHLCVDPILTASSIVVRLQSIVSREVAPGELAVVSCGSFHSGEAANIIPDYADLKVTVRAYLPHVREKVLAALHRIVESECEAAGATPKPVFKTIMRAPPTINDPEKTEILGSAFKAYFGKDFEEMELNPGSEDFSVLATARGIPYLYWIYGGADAEKYEAAEKEGKINEKIPYNHSSLFAPVIEPTMRTAVDAFALAALTFLDGITKL